MAPQVPGARILEVVDTSRHGLRCRILQPVRPGRTMSLRLPLRGVVRVVVARVLRCEVCRLSRHGVQYEAAWAVDEPWGDG